MTGSPITRQASRSSPDLSRTTFATPRAAEFLEVRALQTQTGQVREQFGAVVLKELLDNALDAAESNAVSPVIDVSLHAEGGIQWLSVSDNGPGMPAETIERILDFNVLVSDKAAYRSATRGRQGNAWKTLLGIPYALGVTAPVVIEARGIRHEVAVGIDPAGSVVVRHVPAPSEQSNGTSVTVPLPADLELDGRTWARRFAIVNPHAAVSWQGNKAGGGSCEIYKSTASEGWRKPLPTDPTSPHWYDEAALRRLVFAHIGAWREGGRDLPLGEFIRQFTGLSSSVKAKAVRSRLPRIERLSDFEADPEAIDLLLAAVREYTKAPKPHALGHVPEEHYRALLDGWFGVERFWFKRKRLLAGEMPWVLEVAVAVTGEPGALFTAANYSPTFGDHLAGTPLAAGEVSTRGAESFLRRCDAYPDPDNDYLRAAVLHVICPGLEFTDKGKTQLVVPEDIAREFADTLRTVTKVLAAEKKRRARDARRSRSATRRVSARVTLKSAAYAVMREAAAHASEDGRYEVPARNLYYAVRDRVQAKTPEELTFKYFDQILVEYQQQYGPIRGLYRDPRGELIEPHTGKVIRLGTREVASYQLPEHLYGAILYVEKEGFEPILRQSQIAERYDVAIASGKGQPVEAVRALFERAEHGDYKLFVLHDADPYGYSIARTLSEATARMPGYSVDVQSIGLHVAEAQELDLPVERFTRKNALPGWMPARLSDVEREWFEGAAIASYPYRRQWECTRVELNAFTPAGLIAYIERGLQQHGLGKVIPPAETLNATAHERQRGALSTAVDEILAELLDREGLVDELVTNHLGEAQVDRAAIVQEFASKPPVSWTDAVEGRVRSRITESHAEIRESVRAWLAEHGGGDTP